jgi:hypothetical protein
MDWLGGTGTHLSNADAASFPGQPEVRVAKQPACQ